MSKRVKRLCGIIGSILAAMLAAWMSTGCTFKELTLSAKEGALKAPPPTYSDLPVD